MVGFTTENSANPMNGLLNLEPVAERTADATHLMVNPGDWDFIVPGNFDGDRPSEIALYQSESGILMINNPETGSWVKKKLSPKKLEQMVAVDCNQDGIDEIVFCKSGRGAGIYVLDARRMRFISRQKLDKRTQYQQIAAGDFDQDGKMELACYRNFGYIYLYKAGALAKPRELRTDLVYFDLMSPIDADADGFEELALYRRSDRQLILYSVDQNKTVYAVHLEATENFDGITSIYNEFAGLNEIALFKRKGNSVHVYTPAKAGPGEIIEVDGTLKSMLQLKM